jgi:hypothetical protein
MLVTLLKRQHAKTLKSSLTNESNLVKMSVFNFSSKPSNLDLIDPELLQNEKKLFEEKVDPKRKESLQIERLAMLEFQKRSLEDKKVWW